MITIISDYSVISLHSQNTNDEYSEQTGIDFLAETSQRDLSLYSLSCNVVAIKRLNGVLAGETDWYPPRAEKEYTHSCFNDILLNYEAYQYNNGKKRRNIRNDTAVVARFLRFADLNGIKTLGWYNPKMYIQCV